MNLNKEIDKLEVRELETQSELDKITDYYDRCSKERELWAIQLHIENAKKVRRAKIIKQ